MRSFLQANLAQASWLSLLLSSAFGLVWAESAGHQHAEPQVLAPGYAPLEYTAPTPGSYELKVLGPAGDGQVLDSSGKRHTLHSLLGDKVTVLSFIYTRCNDVNGCPLASYVLRQVQDRLLPNEALNDQVRLLSVSFDPRHDRPEVLAEYGAYFKGEAFDWHFLTCTDEAALAPILQSYDQWVIKDIDAQGNEVGTISHLLRVFLIDRQRRIRNIYSVSFLHADTVMADIQTLLKEEIEHG